MIFVLLYVLIGFFVFKGMTGSKQLIVERNNIFLQYFAGIVIWPILAAHSIIELIKNK